MTASAAAVLRDEEGHQFPLQSGAQIIQWPVNHHEECTHCTAIGMGLPLSAAVQHDVCDQCISDHH